MTVVLVLTACGPTGGSNDADPGEPSASSQSGTTGIEDLGTTQPNREDRAPANPPEITPPVQLDPPTVTGEVPGVVLAAVVADAAKRAGVAPEAVVVITGQEMVWNDGSLGCAERGQFYTQAPVAGYWVIVEAGGAAFDYRLDDRGGFRLCTSLLPAPGDTVPTS